MHPVGILHVFLLSHCVPRCDFSLAHCEIDVDAAWITRTRVESDLTVCSRAFPSAPFECAHGQHHNIDVMVRVHTTCACQVISICISTSHPPTITFEFRLRLLVSCGHHPNQAPMTRVLRMRESGLQRWRERENSRSSSMQSSRSVHHCRLQCRLREHRSTSCLMPAPHPTGR